MPGTILRAENTALETGDQKTKQSKTQTNKKNPTENKTKQNNAFPLLRLLLSWERLTLNKLISKMLFKEI